METTVEKVQDAIRKGHHVCIKGHNEGLPVTELKVWNNIITIEAGNVRRFKIGALNYILNRVVIIK